jgi:hypothetical protein
MSPCQGRSFGTSREHLPTAVTLVLSSRREADGFFGDYGARATTDVRATEAGSEVSPTAPYSIQEKYAV